MPEPDIAWAMRSPFATVFLAATHCAAARSARPRSPASAQRTAGLKRPVSIEYLTRKMPDSASAMPPIQTGRRAPICCSQLIAGFFFCGGGAAFAVSTVAFVGRHSPGPTGGGADGVGGAAGFG